MCCFDKTGTITQGKMIVRRVWTPLGEGEERTFSVHPGNEALSPEGGKVVELFGEEEKEKEVEPKMELLDNDKPLREVVTIASMCGVAT